MFQSRASVVLISLAAVVLLALGAWLWWPEKPPEPRMQQLADGVEAFHLSDSRLSAAAGYPTPRELHVDGEFFIRVPDAPAPLTVHSRLLVLTVTGKTAFRITAYSHEAGEQVEVLEGHIEARKNYASHYMEPDRLAAGEMTMINRDIDLMEKETTDVAALRAWSDALVAATARRQHAVNP